MNIMDITADDIYHESTTPMHKVGQMAMDQYGNKYRYVKNGLVALVTGNLLQEPVEDTQFDNMAVASTAAIGDDHIHVTNGTTTVTAGMFDDGILHVSYEAGIGQIFHIVNHTTATSGLALIFNLDRPLKIACSTSSKVSVRKNPYNGVIQHPASTQTGGVVGVALYAMTASTATVPVYGWIQSGGEASMLYDDGTDTSNGISGVGPSTSAAGAGAIMPQTGAAGGIVIGFARDVASTDTYQGIVHLNID